MTTSGMHRRPFDGRHLVHFLIIYCKLDFKISFHTFHREMTQKFVNQLCVFETSLLIQLKAKLRFNLVVSFIIYVFRKMIFVLVFVGCFPPTTYN